MIFKAVKKIILDVFDEEEDIITLEANLFRDLGMDHLDILDMVLQIEDVFDMKIPDEEMEQFETVADIVNYVENH